MLSVAPGVKALTLARISRILAAADPNVGQIPQNHVAFVESIREGTQQQQQFYFGRSLPANASATRSHGLTLHDDWSSMGQHTTASGTFAERNLDRHWRNVCTHTLHDPIRWKTQYLGNYVLNGVIPPRNALFW